MTFEQLDLFEENQGKEEPATDEELAQRAVLLYKSGEKSSIPEALVVVFGSEKINNDPNRFERVKRLAENLYVELERNRNVIVMPKTKTINNDRKIPDEDRDAILGSRKMRASGNDQF